MADGSELTLPYQYGFRDLVFGSYTDFRTTDVTGLMDLASVNDEDHEDGSNDGEQPGPSFLRHRLIAFDMRIIGQAGNDIEEKLALARRTFARPRKKDARKLEPFTFWRPGQPKKFYLVRVNHRDIPSNFDAARGFASCSVELKALDPRAYDVDLRSQSVTLAGGQTQGQMTIQGEGDYPDGYLPVIRVEGPCDNPSIANSADDNRSIKLTVSLSAGQVLEIDARTRVVTVNGVRNYSIVRNDNQFWSVLEGPNTIVYNRASSNSAGSSTLTVEWRGVWQ